MWLLIPRGVVASKTVDPSVRNPRPAGMCSQIPSSLESRITMIHKNGIYKIKHGICTSRVAKSSVYARVLHLGGKNNLGPQENRFTQHSTEANK